MELPFVAIIRKPDVQYGTNPSVQRTIPDRHQIYYASVPTWDGAALGADIYTIPQPIPVDISYDVIIICNKNTKCWFVDFESSGPSTSSPIF